MKEGRKAHKGVTVNLLLFQSQNSGHIGTVSYERSQGTPRGESATGRQTSRARAVQWKHRPNRQEYREDWLSWFIVRTHTHTRTHAPARPYFRSHNPVVLRIFVSQDTRDYKCFVDPSEYVLCMKRLHRTRDVCPQSNVDCLLAVRCFRRVGHLSCFWLICIDVST